MTLGTPTQEVAVKTLPTLLVLAALGAARAAAQEPAPAAAQAPASVTVVAPLPPPWVELGR